MAIISRPAAPSEAVAKVIAEKETKAIHAFFKKYPELDLEANGVAIANYIKQWNVLIDNETLETARKNLLQAGQLVQKTQSQQPEPESPADKLRQTMQPNEIAAVEGFIKGSLDAEGDNFDTNFIRLVEYLRARSEPITSHYLHRALEATWQPVGRFTAVRPPILVHRKRLQDREKEELARRSQPEKIVLKEGIPEHIKKAAELADPNNPRNKAQAAINALVSHADRQYCQQALDTTKDDAQAYVLVMGYINRRRHERSIVIGG